MVKGNLALADFAKADVYASGVENVKYQKVEAKDLPICHHPNKVTARTAKVAKPRKVCVR